MGALTQLWTDKWQHPGILQTLMEEGKAERTFCFFRKSTEREGVTTQEKTIKKYL